MLRRVIGVPQRTATASTFVVELTRGEAQFLRDLVGGRPVSEDESRGIYQKVCAALDPHRAKAA